MKKAISKFVSPLVAVALLLGVAGVVNVFAESPHSADISIDNINGIEGPDYNFSCPNNPLFSPVTVNGSGQILNPQGQFPDQYHVSIDWGDGSPLEVLDFDPLSSGLSYTATPGTGHDLTVDFDYDFGPHDYDVNTGFSITVKVYHAENAGQDATDATATVVTTCVVPHPAFLNVIKHVVGGELSASAFSMHVKADGVDLSASPFDGDESGTEIQVEPGTYTVSEDSNTDYAVSFSESCPNGVITLGDDEHLTCTVTNTFIEPTPTWDLEITKTVDNDHVNSGDTVVFAITIVNNGPDDASDVTVNDLLPAGFTFVSDDGALPTSYDDVTGVWTLGILQNGTPATLHITATASGAEDAVLTNTASTTDNTPEDSDDSDSVTVTINNLGCTDEEAINFDEGATVDDESCIYNGTLTVTKNTVGGNGTFGFSYTEGSEDNFDITTVGGTGNEILTLAPGLYSVSEISSPSDNWSETSNNCSEVEVTSNGEASCTIVNTFTPDPVLGCMDDNADNFDANATQDDGSCTYTATINVIKHTVNGNGTFNFTDDQEDSFQLTTVEGVSPTGTFIVHPDVNGSSYDVTEYDLPENWNFTSVECLYDNNEVGTSISNGETVTLDPGDEVTCTFTNTFVPPSPTDGTLTVTKVVTGGGTKVVSDFPLFVGATSVTSGVSHSFAPGTYQVSETNSSGYTTSFSGGCTSTGMVTVTSDQSSTCTITNTFIPVEEEDVCPNIDGVQTEVPRGKHIGSSGNCISNSSGGGSAPQSNSGGEVLGATTELCNWDVNTYMRKGYKNNVAQVKILQQDLLNGYMHSSLVVDGIFGPLTEAAVKAFQVAKKDKILTPWNLTLPTGIFYKTTLVEAKNTICPEVILPIPTDLIPWSKNPTQVPPPVPGAN